MLNIEAKSVTTESLKVLDEDGHGTVITPGPTTTLGFQ